MVLNDVADSLGKRTILVVTAGMGGGHLGASGQLAAQLEACGYHAPVFDFLGGMGFGYGRMIGTFYRLQLHYAMWSYRAIYELWRDRPERLASANAVNTRMARDALTASIDEHQPIAVVSTYNLATQVLGALTQRGAIEVPTFTFMTDFGVHPYWLHPAMSGYLTVHGSTARAVRTMTDAPVVVTGPFVAPTFGPDPQRRAASRASLGVAGAWGVGDLGATITDLDTIGGVTPVVVCGDNPRLTRRLRRTARNPAHVFGYVDTMPALMDAADVLIENAGGLTAMEAFASDLPVITYRPIPAHGTDNAHAMAAAAVTRFAPDRDTLARVLSEVATSLVDPERSRPCRDRHEDRAKRRARRGAGHHVARRAGLAQRA